MLKKTINLSVFLRSFSTRMSDEGDRIKSDESDEEEEDDSPIHLPADQGECMADCGCNPEAKLQILREQYAANYARLHTTLCGMSARDMALITTILEQIEADAAAGLTKSTFHFGSRLSGNVQRFLAFRQFAIAEFGDESQCVVYHTGAVEESLSDDKLQVTFPDPTLINVCDAVNWTAEDNNSRVFDGDRQIHFMTES